MKQRKIRKPLRRLGILALVLVMLLNAIPAQATSTGEPTVTVTTYANLMSALEDLDSGSVIGIGAAIRIPVGVQIGGRGNKSFTLKRMNTSGSIIFSAGAAYVSSCKDITFDGNSGSYGSISSFVNVQSSATFDGCTFINGINSSMGA